MSLMSDGSAFQARGPAMEKASLLLLLLLLLQNLYSAQIQASSSQLHEALQTVDNAARYLSVAVTSLQQA